MNRAVKIRANAAVCVCPTARDAVEKILAESVRMTTRHLNDCGDLPPPPQGLTFEYLDQHLVVKIDPHKSIHAMGDLAKGAAESSRAVGFQIVRNMTNKRSLLAITLLSTSIPLFL